MFAGEFLRPLIVTLMGRKTLESFPNGLPLKNRINIVITSNKEYEVKGAVVVHSIEEALEEIKKIANLLINSLMILKIKVYLQTNMLEV